MTLTRRQLLGHSIAAAGAIPFTGCSWHARTLGPAHYQLTAVQAPVPIVPGGPTPALTFDGTFPAPVLRARQGETLRVDVTNLLDQPTTIHWHGLRLPNAMDGVPWITQKPIAPGESFTYEFICPDAGTFWYHPHVNSVEQLGKGLVGMLVVQEREPVPYQSEVLLGLKDWRLHDNGSFMPISDPRQAARTGTLGNVKTINGVRDPVIEVPANTLIRLRVANMDITRLYHLSLPDAEACVIALDGNPLGKPFDLEAQPLGAGMRMDVGLITPAAGQEITLCDRKGRFDFPMCKLRTVPVPASRRYTGDIPALPPNPLSEPSLGHAQNLNFIFEWAGALSPVQADGTMKSTFWLINRRSWEGASESFVPAPLARLELGQTYVLNMHNASPHTHPIHLHGYSFRVLSSDKRPVIQRDTDTVLMEKNERMKVALVADNPGRWMFHCHVVEHMKTGFMGYISVE